MFKEIEQTGGRAMAEKLTQAWERADRPVYQEAILRNVQILKTIVTTQVVLDSSSKAQGFGEVRWVAG
jgi:hypothetical protein